MIIGINYRQAYASHTGISEFIKNLYSRLPNTDQENSYVFIAPSHPLGAVQTLWYENFTLLTKIFRNKITLLHGPSHTLPWFKPPGVKFLLTIHDLSFIVLPHMGDWFFKHLYKYWLGRSVQLADYIVTDSENTKRDVMKYFKVKKSQISTIYLGISSNFKPAKTKGKERYLMTVATHPYRKNLEILVQAFIKLSQKHNLTLKVIGDLSEDDLERLKLAGLIKRVRHFKFVPQKQLIGMYQHTAAFVYPSLYEGFGLPVLEAMACGVPTLCSDNSSLPEIQTDQSQRFDPHNLSELTKKIERILQADTQLIKKISHSNISIAKKFTWEKTSSAYKKVIQLLN